jgi:hypothetical protein
MSGNPVLMETEVSADRTQIDDFAAHPFFILIDLNGEESTHIPNDNGPRRPFHTGLQIL